MAVILALVGVLMVARAASAQALFYSDGLAIYDSSGKKVGRPSSRESNGTEVVFRTRSGHTVFVQVTAASLTGNAGAALSFPERGCRGLPFLNRTGSGRQSTSWVGGPRQTVYVQAGTFSRQTMRSYLWPDGQCWNSRWTTDFAPAALAGIDLADYFTPPFALRAAPGEPIPTGAVAEPLDRTDRLVVVDSTGKKVAPLEEYVVVTDSGITLSLLEGGGRYFQSTDCSGVLFVRSVRDSLVSMVQFVGPRRTVYLPSEAPRWRKMYSHQSGDECEVLRGWHGGGHEWVGITGSFAPTASIGIDLADYFTEPFTVRAGRGMRSLPPPD